MLSLIQYNIILRWHINIDKKEMSDDKDYIGATLQSVILLVTVILIIVVEIIQRRQDKIRQKNLKDFSLTS